MFLCLFSHLIKLNYLAFTFQNSFELFEGSGRLNYNFIIFFFENNNFTCLNM